VLDDANFCTNHGCHGIIGSLYVPDGHFPPDLDFLTNLRTLNVSGNDNLDKIGFGNWKMLRVLDFSRTAIAPKVTPGR